jgi:hypothetical protein
MNLEVIIIIILLQRTILLFFFLLPHPDMQRNGGVGEEDVAEVFGQTESQLTRALRLTLRPESEGRRVEDEKRLELQSRSI